MSEKIKMLVCTHKKSALLNNEYYKPIQVGRLEVNFDLGFLKDCEGENIGDKHYTFSEYSGLYWAWKNIKNTEIFGWCHYRRYFLINNKKKTKRETIIISEADMFRMDFTTEILEDTFTKYDVILPNKRYFRNSIWETMKKRHIPEDLNIVEEVLGEKYPSYIQTFDRVLKKSNKVEQLSMLITKWEIFDDYCNWLFSILFEIEKRTNPDKNTLHTERKIAFIAEQLTPVYFHHHNFKIKHIPVAYVNPDQRNISMLKYFGSTMKKNLAFYLKRFFRNK